MALAMEGSLRSIMPQVIVSCSVRLMVAPVRSFYCRVALIEAENTSGLLELYTRFLQCFVSATDAFAKRNSAVAIGSIQLSTISQNAGCTMAIHANCTKAKKS
jgi:hypothetical protein